MQVEASVMQQIMAGGKCVINSAVSPNVERILINRANPNAPGDQRSEPTTKHPFFSDLNVRKAFAMAIDRDTMAKQLYGEAGTGTCNIVTAPDSIASQNTKSLDVCKFDAAAAAKLLDDAGWVKGSDGIRAKGGVKMKVTYNTSTNDLRQKEQAFVKQAWEALGVQVELHNTPAKVFFGSDVGNPDTAAHMYYDVEMFTNGSDQPDPTNYLAGWQSSRIAQKSNNWKGDNYERFNSKEYDDLFAQFKKETDQTKRNQLAIQMNDLLVKDVVIIPLVARKFPIAAAAKDLKGLKPTPWDSDLWNIADWSK
jgi:peptide/nickel transport system substrate-binding protein